jgi:Right handed beta helix region
MAHRNLRNLVITASTILLGRRRGFVRMTRFALPAVIVLVLVACASEATGPPITTTTEQSTTTKPRQRHRRVAPATTTTTIPTTTAPATTTTTIPPRRQAARPRPTPGVGPPPGTTFTIHNGDLNLTTDGAVVDAVHVDGGTVQCHAADVIVRNAKIINPGHGIQAGQDCRNLTIDHVEIDCENTVGAAGFIQNRGFVGQGIVFRNVEAHRCENGIFIDNGVAVYDSWIHEPLIPGDTSTGAHSDGIQLWAGASDVTIEGNVIDYRGDTTSAIMSGPNPTPDASIRINGNRLAGGSFSLYLPNHDSGRIGTTYTNVEVSNNRFGQGAFAYGYCTGWVDEITEWSSNVIDETGASITRCS